MLNRESTATDATKTWEECGGVEVRVHPDPATIHSSTSLPARPGYKDVKRLGRLGQNLYLVNNLIG
jgi:hypothetical protein